LPTISQEAVMTHSRRSATDVLRTRSASTCLPVPRKVAWQCIEELVAELWTTETVAAQAPLQLLHSVVAEGGSGTDIACWLTWTLTALSPTDTRVDVSHCEEGDDAPEPELGLLLCRLATSASRSAADRS
jgi:hypothetical protein